MKFDFSSFSAKYDKQRLPKKRIEFLIDYLEKDKSSYLTGSSLGFDVLFVDGHTEKQMIPVINYKGQKIAFAADLIPTHGHVPLPYIPGYDIRPLVSLKEKD